jgi:hypothetical protein
MKSPPRWTTEQLGRELTRSVTIFKRERLEEPLEAYLEQFEIYQGRVEELVEATVDLTQLRAVAAEILTNPQLLEVFRYLPGPPISTADLTVLSDAVSLSGKRLRADPGLVEQVVETVMLGLDRRRFPWVADRREPDESERHAAIIATAALMATQRVGTTRRNRGKTLQEGLVEDALLSAGLTKVARRSVVTSAELPGPGEFCGESRLGSRKADFIIRLWDNRTMPVECKVSNSATNSVKRLNNDAAAKAEAWRRDFGETQVVPCAVLGGVYKVHNLEDAQRRGLTLFWAHDLEPMLTWIESTRPAQRS